MNTYRRLLQYLKPYWSKLLLAVICTSVVSGVDGTIAWLVKPVIDDIFIQKNIAMLKLLTVVIIALYLIKGIFRFAAGYLMNYTGYRIVTDLRNTLFKHTQTLSTGFFGERMVGGLLSRIINDISSIQGMVSVAIKDMIRELFTMIVLIGVLFYRDWQLAIISLLVLPPSAYFMARIGNKLRYLGKKSQEKIADLSSALVEAFSGIRVIKAFCREGYIVDKFISENRIFFNIMKRSIKYRELTSPFIEFIGAIGLALIIWYGGKGVIEGAATAGTFFSFMTALLMLYSPIRRLSNISNNIQHASASAVRIFELFDTRSDIKEKKDAVTVKSFSRYIEFNHVCFKYDSDSDMVLNNICLKANKGEIIAIVGMSGVGKTTMINLLPRFYDVADGYIAIDGLDIRDMKISSLRSMIGIVTQEIFLFNDTIKNNIAFGDPDAFDDRIREAAKQAYAHQFIMNLPQQYNTVIGERGIKLSGGERQRIAIARALLKDPYIMILDEATSALDAESEHIVQQALNNLMKSRTTFVIAHRFSTILDADKIVVLENGRISETGKHNELLENAGSYKKVFDMQFAASIQ